MLDPVVQSALVVLLAYLIQLGCNAVGLPLDPATINSVAAVIVAYILSKFGLAKFQQFAAKFK